MDKEKLKDIQILYYKMSSLEFKDNLLTHAIAGVYGRILQILRRYVSYIDFMPGGI
jgi:hypothetical protein